MVYGISALYVVQGFLAHQESRKWGFQTLVEADWMLLIVQLNTGANKDYKIILIHKSQLQLQRIHKLGVKLKALVLLICNKNVINVSYTLCK